MLPEWAGVVGSVEASYVAAVPIGFGFDNDVEPFEEVALLGSSYTRNGRLGTADPANSARSGSGLWAFMVVPE